MERSIVRHAIRLAQPPRPTSLPRSLYSRSLNLSSQHLRFRSGAVKKDDQAYPLTGYYADILSPHSNTQDLKDRLSTTPISKVQPQTRTAPEPPSPGSLPKTDREETLEKARIVFGSRLAGPGERKEELAAASQDVAGVLVPPRPTEPDDCCMSGCVNCVWDIYREEFEEWTAKSAAARENIQAQRKSQGGAEEGASMPTQVASSMDDDGGGSEALWTEGSGEKEKDPFADVPVGIREFMRTEKMLKQKHAAQGSKGG